MDIDDFLDRELQAEKKEGPPKAKPDVKIEHGSVDDPIGAYFTLMEKLLEMKFSWDDDLYKELRKAESQVKSKIEVMLPSVAKQKNDIKQLIDKAINELNNKNIEAAIKLYSEINAIHGKIPDFLIEEKKEVNRGIIGLYSRLQDSIDMVFLGNLQSSVMRVEKLVNDSIKSIRSLNISLAKDFYSKALEMHKSLPDGFLMHKVRLGSKLLALYRELSIHTQISSLKKQLGQYPQQAQTHEKAGQPQAQNFTNNGSMGKYPMQKGHVTHLLDRGGKIDLTHYKTLSNKLVSLNLDKAKISMKNGSYHDARKNLQSVLKLDPKNKDAKQMLIKMSAAE
jgi:tetratricopeptide (TPR) repeat protein